MSHLLLQESPSPKACSPGQTDKPIAGSVLTRLVKDEQGPQTKWPRNPWNLDNVKSAWVAPKRHRQYPVRCTDKIFAHVPLHGSLNYFSFKFSCFNPSHQRLSQGIRHQQCPHVRRLTTVLQNAKKTLQTKNERLGMRSEMVHTVPMPIS